MLLNEQHKKGGLRQVVLDFSHGLFLKTGHAYNDALTGISSMEHLTLGMMY